MRRKTVGALAVFAVLVATAGGATSAASGEVVMQRFPTPVLEGAEYSAYGADLGPSADGGVVRLLNGSGVERIGPRGDSAARALPAHTSPAGGTYRLLQDGSAAFLATSYDADWNAATLLVTLPPSGVGMRLQPFPRSLEDVYAHRTAIAPDGSVWQVRRCGNVLVRWRPGGGAPSRRRIGREGCRDPYFTPATYAFGPRGTVWVGQPCLARIVRVSLTGRTRVWSLPPRRTCSRYGDGLSQEHPALLPGADGGLRFVNGHIDARGHLHLSRETPPDAVGPDGGEWWFRPQAIVRRGPDGRVRRFAAVADGRRYVAVALGPDGRLWYLRARIGDGLSAGNFNYDFVLGALDASGRDTREAMIGEELHPALVPSGHGALWLGSGSSTLRVDLARLAPGGSRTRIVGQAARRGSTVWIQLACSASRPGTICTGVVGLSSAVSGRALARASARFAIPAGARLALPLSLTSAAQRALRAGSLRARAVVRGAGTFQEGSGRLRLR